MGGVAEGGSRRERGMPEQSRAAIRLAVSRRVAEQGISWRELAEMAGVSENTVLGFKNGKTWPHTATLGRLSTALGWPAGQLEDVAAAARRQGTRLDPDIARILETKDLPQETKDRLIALLLRSDD